MSKASYDEADLLGGQAARAVMSAGGSSNRTMTWTYYPDGKLRTRADDGVPVGKQVVLVDNSDFNNTAATGTWTAATSATRKYGHNYTTRPAGVGANGRRPSRGPAPVCGNRCYGFALPCGKSLSVLDCRLPGARRKTVAVNQYSWRVWPNGRRPS
ncbi:hypothetical protein [Micromonospora sagamiensis]|uniref:hypothetical protein n=1 Tax=Micromonospora sagamiensis TaxID=47875 RepID=UPI0011A5ECD0|nr:hypothetical protein [Micromonospora sagamiensis]BCL12649.1 hypothetical protein GCM10017556_03880 [Micromonospora sagamiensis]